MGFKVGHSANLRDELRVGALLVAVGIGGSGCVSAPNDVAQGVGFNDYQSYLAAEAARREALRTPPQAITAPQTAPIVANAAAPAAPVLTQDQILAARARAAIEAAAPQAVSQQGARAIAAPAPAASTPPVAVTPIASAAPVSAPPTSATPRGISDEQDFNAVSARETIESDAERRARMQQQLVVVAPEPLPERPQTVGPSVLNYALATSHPMGQRVYARSPLGRGRHAENCAAYRGDDLAQEDFLARGGPNRDPMVLDPDGDGYACGWDPAPYRAAAQAARATQ